MVYYYPHNHQAHHQDGHQERPERVEAVVQGLQAVGGWEGASQVEAVPLPPEVLYAVHQPAYLERLPGICARGDYLDLTTYTTPASYLLARHTAAGAAALAGLVWQANQADQAGTVSGLALTRPPGHHAGPAGGMGFCLLNNVALAAEYLSQKYAVQRIAIVDFDLHHGNGTQDIFWRRNDVFYFSTHQAPLFPGSGRLDELGAGAGEGYNANFPLPPGTGDVGFQTILDELILPLLDRYKPEIILVSAGFDPHWRDPFGHLQLSASGYGRLVDVLTRWADNHCQGRIAFFMEGGYDLAACSACAQALYAAICQLPWQDSLGPTPLFEGKSWQTVVRQAHEIWKI